MGLNEREKIKPIYTKPVRSVKRTYSSKFRFVQLNDVRPIQTRPVRNNKVKPIETKKVRGVEK